VSGTGTALLDRWGAPVTARTPAAVDFLDAAVGDLVAFGTQARTLTTRAVELDEELILGECLMAFLELFSYTRAGVERARAHVARARELIKANGASAREAAHAEAAACWCEGDISGAIRIWERQLVSEPTDLLAVRLAHDGYYFLGDSLNLRDSPARILGSWNDGMHMASYVRAMYAFGLEECGSYARAESVARGAAEAAPADVWAHHCVAHVLEMEGRTAEGDEYMRESRRWWEHSGFPKHLWWHWGLFHLERGEIDAALAIYDDGLRFDPDTPVLELIDAAGLLWRLFLFGKASEDRRKALADAMERHVEEAVYAFNDMHTAMGLGMAGREDAGRALLAAMAERSVGDNQRMSARAGLSVARGVAAFCRGDYGEALEELLEGRYRASVFGGSNAQRDVLNLTVIAAAARGGNHHLVDALRSERLAVKPAAEAAVDRLIDANLRR
jgi:tetratricopeptide (TPR) repeat protein